MKAREIMSAPVITVRADTHVKDVARILIDEAIGAVPVVDDRGAVVGIVSEADLVRLEQTPDPRTQIREGPYLSTDAPRTAAEIMTAPVISLSESAEVAEAARVMLEQNVKHIPIVSNGRLVGIVARRDVLRVLVRSDDAIARELRLLLAGERLLLGNVEADVTDGIVTLSGPRAAEDRRLAEVLARGVPGVVAVRFSD